MRKFFGFSVLTAVTAWVTITLTQSASAAVDPETAFIFNTLSFLMHGFLVMWMAAGFCMLEVGLVRSKNATMQCAKNITLYSSAALMYWLVGYNLMYMDVSGYIGSFAIWSGADDVITADGFTGDGSVMRLHPTGSSRWSSWRRPHLSYPVLLPNV